MGAARRWKFLPFRSPLPKPAAASKPKQYRVLDVLATSPSPSRKEEEEVPGEFLCPILRAPMADPVILPSGRTYEHACVRACADLGLALGPDGGVVAGKPATAGAGGAAAVAIPNTALRAAVRTWCARSGHAPPLPPSDEEAREAVLRIAPVLSASNLSCSTSRASAASTTSSSSSSSSGGSSTEMAPAVQEVEIVRVKDATAAEEEEEEAWARAVEAGDETEVESAMSALRRATRESEARRRALCTPRLLAALRRALLSPRHRTPAARADAAAALANLALEPSNRVPIVRAGAVPALIDALAAPSSPPEAREHAAGALFGLALHEGNRAAVGVLGAVPPLLAALADPLPVRARRDAGAALFHLSLAAVNQSKIARAGGGARTLLAVASDHAEPSALRRIALMVACNVAACAEGRAALMDAGAVAAVTAILSDSDDATAAPPNSEDLHQWCVAAMHGMSRGSCVRQFRGLARAAGADRALTVVAERASPGSVHKEMAQTVLRVVLGLSDDDDQDDGDHLSDREGNGSFAQPRPQRRRAASWAAAPPAAATTLPSAHQWRSVCID